MGPEVWSQIATAGGVVGFLVLLVTITVRYFITPYLRRVISEAHRARVESQATNEHVRRNGSGASVLDSLTRLEERQEQMCRSLTDISQRLDTTVARVSELNGKQQIILRLVSPGRPDT